MKRKLLSILVACSILAVGFAPTAQAASAPAPTITYELEGGETVLTLSLGGLNSTAIYAVQLELPITAAGSDLKFYPDSELGGENEGFYSELKIRAGDNALMATLYLDAKVPLNATSTVVLGTLTSSTKLSPSGSATLTILQGQLKDTVYSNVPVTKAGSGGTTDPIVPPPSSGSGGGSSGSSSSTDKEDEDKVDQKGKTMSVTSAGNGLAAVSAKALSAAERLEVKGDAVLTFEGSALKSMKAAGGDLTINSAAIPSAKESRGVRAQLNGAALYEIAVMAGGKSVDLSNDVIQVSVPFAGKGRPVAYLVTEGSMTKLGPVTLERGAALFSLPGTSSAKVAVLDVVHNFTDVDGWYDGYVNAMTDSGVMTGVSTEQFMPEKIMTRAELVTTLARLSGDTLGGSTAFSDVPADAWFAPYVVWAVQSGVTSGVSETQFAPQDGITREQMAAMLTRFSAYRGIDLGREQPAAAFTDSAQISAFATESVGLMQQAGVLSGKGDGRFDPQGTATRAECAKMLSVVMMAMSET